MEAGGKLWRVAVFDITANDVARSVEEARHVIRVLMAYKCSDMKRRLMLAGNFKEHLDSAAKYVVDNTWYLTILLSIVNERSFFGWRLRRKFKKLQAKFSDQIKSKFESSYGEGNA